MTSTAHPRVAAPAGLRSAHAARMLTVSLVLLLGASTSAHALPLDCERAIAKASSKFVRANLKAQRKCNDSKLKSGVPTTCPDIRAAAKVASAAAKLRTSVSKACGGPDKNCGVGGDDEPLAAIGWDIGSCPNIENGSCSGAINHCSDISDCVLCIDDAAVDQAIALYYEDAAPSANPSVIACQRAIGKSAEKFFATKNKALHKCEDRVLLGILGGPCPDATAASKIARAESKKIASICRACGGADQACGTPDDLTVATIGFAANCADVTVPGGGPACGGPVATLPELVACVDCVTEFKADCVDAAAVPAVATYPSECNGPPAPTATTTPTPTPTRTPTPTLTTMPPTFGPSPTATRTATPTAPPATPSTTPALTATATPGTTATATLVPPTATATVTVAPTPTITLPLPTITLPLPTITLPLPTITLPIATPTLPLPTPTAACGNGVIEGGEACELPGIGCSGLLPICLLCLQCVGL